MATFNMMVGIAGSGKSTFIQENKGENDVVISSDAIRIEKGYAPNEVKDVFAIMFKRTCKALETNHNVWYDATNLNSKRRRNLIKQIKQKFKNEVYFQCYVIAPPVDIIRKQNKQREAVVPDEAIDKMLQAFQIPIYQEGWDYIEFDVEEDSSKYEPMFKPLYMIDFDQHNSHHSLTLAEHCKTCKIKLRNMIKIQDIAANYKLYLLLRAAEYHDIGKLYTQTYYDKNGNKSEDAHYYGHDSVGAYIYLSERMAIDGSDKTYFIATLINYHMRPYFAHWEDINSKARQRDFEFFGKELFNYLSLLNQADRKAK